MSFVDQHRDRFGVEPILRVLEVPTSTFYGWGAQQRDPCQHRRQDAWLLGKIRAVHQRSGGTYGAPRVHAQLRRDGVRVSRKRVARLLATHGLQGAFLRKRWRSTRQDPKATPAPDLVNRNFKVDRPNRLWVADISRIPTGAGPLWLGERPRRLLAADRGLEGQRPGRHRAGAGGVGVRGVGPRPGR